MKEPLISVLIPSYNHERYVEAAVRSVLAQDWPRIELIVVDDGSKDGTWDVLQRLRAECERRFERLVLERQPNRGTCATVGRLLGLARGEFVALFASDDMYLPGAFSTLVPLLMRNQGIGVAVGENGLMDANGRTCYWDADRRTVYDPSAAAFRTLNEQMASVDGVSGRDRAFGTYRALLRSNHVANGAVIRKRCLDAVESATPEAPLEDWWMMMQLSKVTRMVSTSVRTFRYRWHPTNTVKDKARMELYFRLNLRKEEQVLFQNRDWNHLSQYLEVFGAVVDERRRGPWHRKVTYVTESSLIRKRNTLGFVTWTREDR